MKKVLYTQIILFGIVLFLGLFSPKNILAITIFEDNFDSGLMDKWNFIGSSGWIINDGQMGIYLNPGLSNALPKLPSEDSAWKNFILDVDLRGVSGTDKNIAFRFIDENNRYEVHHSLGKIYLDRSIGGSGSTLSICSLPVCNLENNKSYHFKIIVNNINVKVFLDTINIFDINDSFLPMVNGKIGLRVGTGAVSPSEVWYDNVLVTDLNGPGEPTLTPTPTSTPTLTPTPTPTPIQNTPIVFLPGLGGSFNFKEMFLGLSNPDGWRMTPGANVYNNLLKTFAGKDYFWIFYYDWRNPVIENSQKLNDYIKNTVKPLNNKVNLVGHSLGGLVARTCVQKTENNCYVDKLITVGSPQAGAIDAYPALEGGEIWRTGPIKLGYELFLHFNQRPGETTRDTLERIAPVLKDLLPNFNYLTKNNVNLPPSALAFQNSLLPQLVDLTPLESKTNTIIGRNFNTVETIVLTNRSFFDKILGNWPDGKPINKIYSIEGDNSVLTKSSSFANPNIQNWPFNLDHGGIISQNEPLHKILTILNQDLAISTENIPDAENFLVFFVHSPVKFALLNPPPNAYSEDEIIIIPNPENKNYQLTTEGLNNGSYSLSVGQIFGESAFWSDYFGKAELGGTKSWVFSINSQNPKTEPLIDNTGNSNKFFVSSLVGQLIDEVLKFGIEKNKQDLLIANLILIKPSNPEGSLGLLGSFRSLIALYEKGYIISMERANFFRNRSSSLAKYLETLAFLSPKSTKKNVAQNGISSVKKAQSAIKIEKLSKNSVFVYLEAEEKLQKAETNFSAGFYYQTKIYSLEAKNLFTESNALAR